MQQLTTNYTLHYVEYTGIWLRTIKWSLPSVGWQRKAVQGPGDLWCWIPSSGALQGYSRARLQRLFDKRIEQHRWCVCEQRKQDQDTYISRYPSFLTFFPFPTTLVLCSRFIRLQRSIWSTRGYETAREISKEIPSTEEEKFFFFFLTLLLDTDWTFDRGEVPPFPSVDSKRGWRKAEREAEEERSSQLDQRIAIRFVNDRDAIGSISLKTIRGKVREQQVRVELDSR